MVDDGPFGVLGFVTEVAQVVNVAEQLVLKLNILNFRHWAELQ